MNRRDGLLTLAHLFYLSALYGQRCTPKPLSDATTMLIALSHKYTAEYRFWYYTDKKGPDDCWNWKGSLCGRDGRGRLRVSGENVYAHVFSYQLHIGDIPVGIRILHKCDNPRCVNPAHLFLGTHSDNMKDAYKKRRKSNSGVKNPKAKLTEEQVREIRRRYPKEGGVKLAKEFGLERSAPYRIFHRKQWRNVK